ASVFHDARGAERRPEHEVGGEQDVGGERLVRHGEVAAVVDVQVLVGGLLVDPLPEGVTVRRQGQAQDQCETGSGHVSTSWRYSMRSSQVKSRPGSRARRRSGMCPETSQTWAVLSLEAVRTRRPSGLNTALHTGPEWPRSSARSFPEEASQMRAVLSSEAVRTRRPSGLKTALRTKSEWPRSSARSFPEEASQTRAVLSLEAVRTRRPSELKAALNTELEWPRSSARSFPEEASQTRAVLDR